MEQSFGKLILQQQGGPEREFGLSKATITLGRALTNDVVLADTRVSREHARLECSPSGCRIVDLGSSNGTRLNGAVVDEAQLRPGDTIHLGNSSLRYQFSPLYEDLGMTRLDSEADLARSLEQESLPMAINETGTPRLIVVTEQETRELLLQDRDSVTIGRAADGEVVVDQDNVSRQHARLMRQGEGWLLRDLGSTNGTWLGRERVEEHLLADGDVFRVGRTQFVFKAGDNVVALTMADEAFARVPTRRPVVVVPGLMGSDLWLGNERVWPSIKNFLTNPDLFRYPSTVPLQPRGIVDELVIVPNLIKQDQYNRLGDYLVEELGYRRGVDLFEFAYDWRQDVRLSAQQLGQFVADLPARPPVTIMAHSLGTLVSRYYIERLGGKDQVERAMFMGGPHRGTVKGLMSLLVAPSMLPFGLLGERLRQVIITFPSTHQILPTYPCGRDQNGKEIDFLTDVSWAAEEQLPLLRAARDFRRELGLQCSVPAISIFGYGIKTVSGVSLHRGSNGKPKDIRFETELSGDGGILQMSAALPGTEIHPVQQYHGSLFVDNDVRMRLKLELARQLQN